MHYRTAVHIEVCAAITVIGCVASLIAMGYVSGKVARVPIIATAGFYAVPVAASIFWAMWERGLSADRILGYRSTASPTIIGAFLQNTVEQTLLALLAVTTFMAYAPETFAVVPVVAAWLYLIGRVLFLCGYVISPMWRFFGFSINFYTSIALIAGGLWFHFAAA